MYEHHLDLLISPITSKPLQLLNPEMDGNRIKSGILTDGENNFPIRNYIPRFVEEKRDTWSEQWESHPSILHEDTGYDAYKKRFVEETRWPENLSSEVILEAGCGSGSFTKYALETGAMVVSFDLSSSVDDVYERFGGNENFLLVQTSIYELPFKAQFDRVFCFGVIQHTPDPKKSLNHLVSVLKQGGSIATDIYADVDLTFRHGMLRAKYFWRRWSIGRDPKKVHKFVKNYVNFVWPVCQLLKKLPMGLYLSQHLMIDDYSKRMTGMDPKYYREFAVIDIFDMLAPNHDHPATIEDYTAWHQELKLSNIDVHYGYNGLEARAKKAA